MISSGSNSNSSSNINSSGSNFYIQCVPLHAAYTAGGVSPGHLSPVI